MRALLHLGERNACAIAVGVTALALVACSRGRELAEDGHATTAKDAPGLDATLSSALQRDPR
jgi:hypothetical protein